MDTIGRVDEICITAICDCCQCQRQQIIPQTLLHYFPSSLCCEHYGHIISDPNYSSACPFKISSYSSPHVPSSSSSPPTQLKKSQKHPSKTEEKKLTVEEQKLKKEDQELKKKEQQKQNLARDLRQQNLKLKLDVAITSRERPPWSSPELYLLAIQHALVIIWNTMVTPFTLVAVMRGGNLEKAEAIQSSLFVTAITTILQTEFGSELPVMMKRSQAFIIPAISIAVSANTNCSPTLDHRERFKLSVRRVQGASIVASFFQMIGGFSGARKLFARGKHAALNPLASAPFVSLTGLALYSRGYPQLLKCKQIGVPTLVILLLSTQFLPHFFKSKRTVVQRFAAVASVIVVWLFTEISTAAGAFNNVAPGTQNYCTTKRYGHISYTPWIKFFRPFHWGAPIFDKSDFPLMMVAAFVASVESTGTFTAASRLAGGIFIGVDKRKLDRAIGFQGLGTLVEGVFGMGHGSTTSVEHTGFVGLTEIGNLWVVRLSAGFLLILSIIAKFGAILAAVPLPIVAALQILLFPYVATAGIDNLQLSNTNSNRSKFIFGASMFSGVSLAQNFKGYALASEASTVSFNPSTRFNDIIQVVCSSPPTIAAIAALILDKIPYTEEDLKAKGWLGLPRDQEDVELSIEDSELSTGAGEDEGSPSEEGDDQDYGSSSEEEETGEADVIWYNIYNVGWLDAVKWYLGRYVPFFGVATRLTMPIDMAKDKPKEMELKEDQKDKKSESDKAAPKARKRKQKLDTKAAEDGTLMLETLLELEKIKEDRDKVRHKMKATRAENVATRKDG